MGERGVFTQACQYNRVSVSAGELKGEGGVMSYSISYSNLGGHYIHDIDRVRRMMGHSVAGIPWTRHIYIVQVVMNIAV